MNVMLWLFNEHDILPGVYYNLPEGEKALLRIFIQKILESRRQL